MFITLQPSLKEDAFRCLQKGMLTSSPKQTHKQNVTIIGNNKDTCQICPLKTSLTQLRSNVAIKEAGVACNAVTIMSV